MALQKAVDTQRDFTAGELDPTAKRGDDDDFIKKGMRQASNARILNTRGLTQRPGRNLLQSYATAGRVEDVLIAPGVRYRLVFTTATLTIYDSTGTSVFTLGSLPWTAATVGSIVWAVYLKQIFLTFPGMQPLVLTWDGTTTWTSAPYAETIASSGQKRTPFYRLAPQNITMNASTTTGIVNIHFSAPVLVSGMVGTRIRYAGRQVQIKTVVDGQNGTATVIENLPPCEVLTLTSSFGQFNIGDLIESPSGTTKAIAISVPTSQTIFFAPAVAPSGTFLVGDAIAGGTSGATGTVTGINFWDDAPARGISQVSVLNIGASFIAVETITGPHGSAADTSVTSANLTIQLIANDVGHVGVFGNGDTIAGPGGSAVINVATVVQNGQAISVWDQEIMNAYQGWPASVFSDQGRIGFCNFPALPGGIAWSAIGLVGDLYVGANPSDAFFELAPGKSQVQHVVPGPESAEFVFTDIAVYYIPISPTNPLKPGSVQFQKISSDGAAAVQPRAVADVILYVDQGLSKVQSIVATGAYNKPYESKSLTNLHAHLFNGVRAIALPTSVTQFAERYVYVLNGDGTMAVGKYAMEENAKVSGKIGWLPWNGSGLVQWVSALNDVVLMQTDYTSGATAHMLEQLDATQYLDAALPVNAIPSTLTPPGGKGPLWWLPGATVDLMDGLLPLGPHATDANGFLIPLFPGEDLTSATLRAGFTWTGIWEPFVIASGQTGDERMKKRRIARFEPYVMGSTGFRFAKFYSGVIGPNLPALGDIVSDRRIPAYNMGDDANLPPPLREQSYAYKPLGRSHDPRAGIIKDTPGPLTLVEMAAKASI